ncbi:MAG TPA: hypothetical protein VFZ65_09225 [Planctomycetota bacterium]|nr:hypothetical protein [Planctomycetota bacterium]
MRSLLPLAFALASISPVIHGTGDAPAGTPSWALGADCAIAPSDMAALFAADLSVPNELRSSPACFVPENNTNAGELALLLLLLLLLLAAAAASAKKDEPT